MDETVTIAILAKDKAHCLPLYFKCLLAQTFPKDKTYLYIRTNNNTDKTREVLLNWIKEYGHLYKEIFYDDSNLDLPLEKFKPHQWHPIRFDALARIRQKSVEWALKHNSHYFVADCDNFIHPQTIEILLSTHLPVVGPFLITGNTLYSNYHHRVSPDGYFFHDPEYHLIYNQKIKGLINVEAIHCTYLIRREVLDKVSYFEEESPNYRHEYVIFSENLRKAGIQQYLDNRSIYGRISFAEKQEDFLKEPWLDEFI